MRLTTSAMADGHEQQHEQIAKASAAQALPALEDWRRGIASALSGVRTNEDAEKALASWSSRSANDEAVAEQIRQAVLRAAMAGALHVRIVEVPESMRARRASVPPGTHATTRRVPLTDPPPDVADSELPAPEMVATFNLPFDEAVDDFLARGIVTPEQWQAMDDAARRRSFTATRLASDALRARAYNALLRALNEGTTYAQFARDLRAGEESLGLTAADPGYIENVFRTNTAQSYAAGRLEQMQQPEVLAARPYVQFRAIMDSRTTEVCKACDGLVFDRRSDPGWVRFAPPLHFQCFPGDVLVQGRFDVAYRALYEGEMLEVTTKHGRRLRVTPNHPVATTHGFAPAGSLREGDDLIGYEGRIQDDLTPSPERTDVDHQQAPVRIEDVFRSLLERRDAVLVEDRPRSEDFDGDARRFQSEVQVVSIEGVLPDVRHSARGERVTDLDLAPADVARRCGLCGSSDVPVVLVGSGLAADSAPGSAALTLDASAVALHRGPLQALRFGSAAKLNTARSKESDDRRGTDSDFIRELIRSSAGKVAFDQVVGIRKYDFRGHVYDLQSPLGWIMAQDLLVSNCRSTTVALGPNDVSRSQITNSSRVAAQPMEGFGGAPSLDLEDD